MAWNAVDKRQKPSLLLDRAEGVHRLAVCGGNMRYVNKNQKNLIFINFK
jgi:hypothetical protein